MTERAITKESLRELGDWRFYTHDPLHVAFANADNKIGTVTKTATSKSQVAMPIEASAF